MSVSENEIKKGKTNLLSKGEKQKKKADLGLFSAQTQSLSPPAKLIHIHMEGIQNPIHRTVEEVFSDFKGRRAGLLKALTTGPPLA